MAMLSAITQLKFYLFPSSKFRQLCVISGFLTFLTVVLSIVLAMKVFIAEAVSYNVPLQGNSNTTKIAMLTYYIDIDATAGTLTADWYPLANSCEDPEEIVNIYFDRNILKEPGADPSQIASDQPSDRPIFQFNTRTRCSANVRDSLATFRTVAKLTGQQTNSRWRGPSLQWYPFDTYFAQFSLFAQLDSTNASVGTNTLAPFGSPVNFNVKLDQKLSNNTDEGLYLRLNLTRSGSVQLLVVIIALANWFSSIAFLWITVASLLWPEKVVKEMFVIPVAALFAFTSVRSIMPGAPAGFGAFIDFMTILPNLVLMAIFSATLLLVVLFRRTHPKLQEMEEEYVDTPRSGCIKEPREAPNPPFDNDSVRRLLVLLQEVIASDSKGTQPDHLEEVQTPVVLDSGVDPKPLSPEHPNQTSSV